MIFGHVPEASSHFTKIYMMTQIKHEGTEQSSMESKIKSCAAQGICLSSAPAPQSAIRPIGQVLESAVVETVVPLDTQFSSNTL